MTIMSEAIDRKAKIDRGIFAIRIVQNASKSKNPASSLDIEPIGLQTLAGYASYLMPVPVCRYER